MKDLYPLSAPPPSHRLYWWRGAFRRNLPVETDTMPIPPEVIARAGRVRLHDEASAMPNLSGIQSRGLHEHRGDAGTVPAAHAEFDTARLRSCCSACGWQSRPGVLWWSVNCPGCRQLCTLYNAAPRHGEDEPETSRTLWMRKAYGSAPAPAETGTRRECGCSKFESCFAESCVAQERVELDRLQRSDVEFIKTPSSKHYAAGAMRKPAEADRNGSNIHAAFSLTEEDLAFVQPGSPRDRLTAELDRAQRNRAAYRARTATDGGSYEGAALAKAPETYVDDGEFLESVEVIAATAWGALRNWRGLKMLGRHPQYADLADWQQANMRNGVVFHLRHRAAGAWDGHAEWCRFMLDLSKEAYAAGDKARGELLANHEDLRLWDALPKVRQQGFRIFAAIVGTFRE